MIDTGPHPRTSGPPNQREGLVRWWGRRRGDIPTIESTGHPPDRQGAGATVRRRAWVSDSCFPNASLLSVTSPPRRRRLVALLTFLAAAGAGLVAHRRTDDGLGAEDRSGVTPNGPSRTLGSRLEAGIWIDREEIANLPMDGISWRHLSAAADERLDTPRLADRNDRDSARVLAKALVFVRTKDPRYRDAVTRACLAIVGTERGASPLAVGRELIAYVLAADLVRLPPDRDRAFRAWLARVPRRTLAKGRSLVSTHEDRPNNWGTHAGASRAAVAAYLRDDAELSRCARVFRGWLGDRSAYAGFQYGDDRSWQADSRRPVGINPKGARREGRSIDGVLPDDQRRGGSLAWPPAKENYVYEALQGAIAQAVILHRAGYDVWEWEDRALLRAFRWLHDEAKFPAEGDDGWQPHIVNRVYGTKFPAPVPARPGKNVGWADWTHAPKKGARR